jgi:hypothetical protein
LQSTVCYLCCTWVLESFIMWHFWLWLILICGLCCRCGGDFFSLAFLYLPVVAFIVIRESWKVIFNVIRESFKFVNVIRDETPSYRPSDIKKGNSIEKKEIVLKSQSCAHILTHLKTFCMNQFILEYIHSFQSITTFSGRQQSTTK